MSPATLRVHPQRAPLPANHRQPQGSGVPGGSARALDVPQPGLDGADGLLRSRSAWAATRWSSSTRRTGRAPRSCSSRCSSAGGGALRHEVRYLQARRRACSGWSCSCGRCWARTARVQGLCGTLTDVSERRRTERRAGPARALPQRAGGDAAAAAGGAAGGQTPTRACWSPSAGPRAPAASTSSRCTGATAGEQLMSQRAEWCAPGVKPVFGNPLLQHVPVDRDFKRWGRAAVARRGGVRAW